MSFFSDLPLEAEVEVEQTAEEVEDHDDNGQPEKRCTGIPFFINQTKTKSGFTGIKIVEVAISDIKFDNSVPYYRGGSLPHPIITQSGSDIILIDGLDLYEAAKERGDTRITCIQLDFPDYTGDGIAVEITAIRFRPMGGTASFSEIVRNVCILRDILLQNPKFYINKPGRPPKGANNGRIEVTEFLADTLGRRLETIKSYFRFGEDLNKAALMDLAKKDAPRSFYKEIASRKQRLREELEKEGLGDPAIMEEISAKVLEWFTSPPEEDQEVPAIMTYENQEIEVNTKKPAAPKKASSPPTPPVLPTKIENPDELPDEGVEEDDDGEEEFEEDESSGENDESAKDNDNEMKESETGATNTEETEEPETAGSDNVIDLHSSVLKTEVEDIRKKAVEIGKSLVGCEPETVSVKELSEKIIAAVCLLAPLSTRIKTVEKEDHMGIVTAVNG
jgi:hypothetical protein